MYTMGLSIRTSSSQSFTASKILKRWYSAVPDSTIPTSKRRFVPTSGTYPQGFQVSGTHVGIKASNTSFPDLALIVSDRPCTAAAVFTQNKFQAAPVLVSKANLHAQQSANMRGVVINAGCANAVTGEGGLKDAKAMVSALGNCLGGEDNTKSTLVMSTGVIGQRLPIDKIVSGIPTGYKTLSHSHKSWLMAATAICTTDTFPKLLSTKFELPSAPGVTYCLAGMTKGAGMIHPNMATLLGVLATDAPIHQQALSQMLKQSVDRSFNCISIDGDSSTNDTIAIFANGAAGGPQVGASGQDYDHLSRILLDFTQRLSQLVVRDGEGATKFVRIRVRAARSQQSAKAIASTVARSPLVKTALYGKDANWGRILCAVGYTNNLNAEDVVPSCTSVSIGLPKDQGTALKLLVNGEPEKVDESKAAELLENEDLEILITLNTGSEEADYWFCDFSHEYVTINGDYRT